MHSIENMLVAAHAKVIVGAPDSHTFLRHRHMSTRKLLRKAVDVIEVAIRFVLVLLVELILVKLLVIELGGRWSSRLWTGKGFVVFLHEGDRGWLHWFWIGVSTFHRGMASSHTLSLPEHIRIDIGFFLGTCVQLFFKQRFDNATARGSLATAPGEDARALNSERLVHDRASSSSELQVCDSPATGRSMGGGRHGAQGRSRGLFEEGAHALGLSQERFHDEVEIW